jgi:MoxR-like ATPase
MLCHRLRYPTLEEEDRILRQQLGLGLKEEKGVIGAVPKTAFDLVAQEAPVASLDNLVEAMRAVQKVHVSDAFRTQCVEFTRRTREHKSLELGCSPRAGLALVQAARARAFIFNRDFVIPDDLYALAEDVILHRIRLSYEALAEGVTGHKVLEEILSTVG